jgi:hypothetical protein
MAHFAKISEDNLVLNVLTLNNSDMVDENGNPSELIGQQYLEKNNNWPAHLWIQTSINTFENKHRMNGTPFRGNYAGIGWTWNPSEQIFWRPKPYQSWVKDIQNARWQSPIGDAPQLTEEQKNNKLYYDWNESNQVWELKDPNQI